MSDPSSASATANGINGANGAGTVPGGNAAPQASGNAAPQVPGNAAPTAPGGAARTFLQRLEQALDGLATLKVVTVVGPVTVAGGGTGTTVAVAAAAAPVEAASSEIDLLDGHITNTFSPGFAALDGGALQLFHQAQVEKSNAIMLGNLAELQKLAAALLSLRR